MKNSATRCKHAAWQILHSSFLILHFHKESENNYCRCRRSRHTLGQIAVSVVLIGLVVSGGLAAVFKGNSSEIKNIGIGTVITAFCTGPLVTFFNKHVSEKILNVDYGRVGKKLLASLSKKQG